MILSLSGTQGSGKTTLLEELSKLGYNVIDRKSSRSVLVDWNLTLSEIQSDPKLITKFQDEVLLRKYNDENKFQHTKDIWLTDRSFIDLLVYTTTVLGHNKDYTKWLDSYVAQCTQYQQLYSTIFYISPLPIIVDDGVRNTSLPYNQLIDHGIHGYLKYVSSDILSEILTTDHQERITQICTIIGEKNEFRI